MKNLLGIFIKSKNRDKDVLAEYYECEDDIEAALTWLDNHPNTTLEEYEDWLTGREEAMSKIKLSKSKNKD